jgi:glycosyltransferase involved in cell wall biosynthesis
LKIENLRIALFYDWLNQWGGAERVLLDLHELYPNAPIFTLVHNAKLTPWLKNTKIITPKFYLKYPPFYPLLAEQFDFSDYDIVISTTSYFGHCLLTLPKTLYLCYCHTPNRYIWQKSLLSLYRPIDRIYSNRPDFFLASSQNSQHRIKKFYGRDSILVYPGVNLKKFYPNYQTPQNYFLIVSRLVPHKKIDLAIHACHQLQQKLFIVGTGRHQKYLQSIISPYVTFLGQVPEKKLIKLYQNCQALICPQEEDFGLTPIECQACGRPVIAYGRGGITETVADNKTGLFFKHQTINSLASALQKFSFTYFDPSNCLSQANKFSQSNFMLHFKSVVEDPWIEYQTTTIF